MATTWTNPDAVVDAGRVRVAKAACTTGTEVPLQGADRLGDGIDLKGIAAVGVHVETVPAKQTITLVNAVATKMVTINGVVFTAKAGAAGANEFDVTGNDNADAAALAAAINASVSAGIKGLVTATAALNVVTATAVVPGTAANAYGTVSNDASMVCGAATLLGGTDIPAGAALQAVLLNPATGKWNRAPELDLPLNGGAAGYGAEARAGMAVPGGPGRLQFLPNLVGSACSVYLNGAPRPALGAGG